MSCGCFPGILVLLSFLCASSRGETTIFCDLKESCILPCRFQPSDEEVIHWIQQNGGVETSAHSYYYKKNQLTLQDQRFKGRTSLFLDRLSSGNASLLLREVEVQDEGRYKCYTSTTSGHDQSFVQLKVDAPVREVNVDRAGNRVTCRSEGIYPQPELTWSTEPPSDVSLQDTLVQSNEQKLYSITSSLTLSSEDLNVSCTVQTRKNKKKTTLFKPSSQPSENEANLSCTLPTTTRTSLIWRFNQSEDILSQGSDKKLVVSDRWKSHFVELLDSGSLKLKGLTSNEGGRYTCEASNSEETLRSDTYLTIREGQGPPEPRNKTALIVGVVVGLLVVILVVGILVTVVKRRKSKRNNNHVL